MSASDALAGARALLVDLDGTLVDSTAPVMRAWTAFARRHGLDPDAVHQFAQGRPSRDTVRLLAPGSDLTAEAGVIERIELEDTDGVRALPGARELLASGWPLAIVTSCSTALATTRLRAAGLPIPHTLVSCDGLERGKPDPTCFSIAAHRLATPPAGCVAFEDAPAGIQAGHGAGVRVIALRTTHTDHALREADAIVEDLAEVIPLLRRQRPIRHRRPPAGASPAPGS